MLVMMDFPLLLWMLRVCREPPPSDWRPSAIPLPWILCWCWMAWMPAVVAVATAPRSCSDGGGGRGAALAVVPMLHWQLSIK